MPSDTVTVDYDKARGIRIVRTMRSVITPGPVIEVGDAAALEQRLRDEASALGPGGAWLIAWLDYAVVIDAVVPGRPLREAIDPRWLQELRLFSDRGEWRAWRMGDGFAGRRRLDDEGETWDVLDDDQSLWGTKAEPDGAGGTTVSEARGIRYRLPVALLDDDLPLRLTVRQYLSYADDGLAGVVDARLMRLATWHGAPIAFPAVEESERDDRS